MHLTRLVRIAAALVLATAISFALLPAGLAQDLVTREVGGVRFGLPEGWSVSYDSSDDKIFQSPDGRFTVLAFWWEPDEPLTAYEDVTAVAHGIIDREPVTLIASTFPGRFTLQAVTESARDDGRRFIFTVEGEGVSEAEVAALRDRLVATIRWGAVFGREAPPPVTDSQPAPAAALSPMAPPAPAIPPGGGIRTIDFSIGDTGGWTGIDATLSNPGTGGPDGSGYLKAYTPGEGRTGYLVAPPDLLGDWRGYAALRLTLRSKAGELYEPYSHGGRGDVVLHNGTMRASTAFRRAVGSDWTVQEIMLADGANWRLEGGAAQLADVLANVTSFEIRAEYVLGNAEAGLARIDFRWKDAVQLARPPEPSAAPVPPPPVVAPPPPPSSEADPDRFIEQAGGYARYENARFGTFISYPAAYFRPEPPPGNGDGRTFNAIDGQASFFVFAQYNVMDLDASGLLEDDKLWLDASGVMHEEISPAGYVMAGTRGPDAFYRKAIVDDAEGLIRVLEITYPVARQAEFTAVVDYMAASFGPAP